MGSPGKNKLIHLVVAKLTADLELFFTAAKNAHKASIDEENQPDNKYDTLALEASYVAQGQANRAQEIRRSIEIYNHLELLQTATIRMSSLVTLEDDNGDQKRIFIGPAEGGLRVSTESGDVMVITPASPLGNALIGRTIDELVEVKTGGTSTKYHIIGVV